MWKIRENYPKGLAWFDENCFVPCRLFATIISMEMCGTNSWTLEKLDRYGLGTDELSISDSL